MQCDHLNTGSYGGSIAVSPYKRPDKRMIFRHSGSSLSTCQTVRLPVKKLIWAQTNDWPCDLEREFKALPPGAKAPSVLSRHEESVSDDQIGR